MKLQGVEQKVTLAARRVMNQTGLARKKVFAIGFNKTGTSSLHALFESLGLPSYHGTRWRSCDDMALLQAYDCFSDGIPSDLAKIDRLFPGSRFILQVRELDGWIYSRLAHIERTKKAGTYVGKPDWDTTEEAVKTWIQDRNRYHLWLLDYFADRPSDLLVINFIRDASAAAKICRFLGKKERPERPERNVNPSKIPPPDHAAMVSRVLTSLAIPSQELRHDIYCSGIASAEERARFPWDSSKLESDQPVGGNPH